jgi:hypothetical protein
LINNKAHQQKISSSLINLQKVILPNYVHIPCFVAFDGKKRGLTWRLQESLEDMEYADDLCLVSHKYEHMRRKLHDLWKESKKAGLEINSSKTEEIRVYNTI